jgi:hypothetical protein
MFLILTDSVPEQYNAKFIQNSSFFEKEIRNEYLKARFEVLTAVTTRSVMQCDRCSFSVLLSCLSLQHGRKQCYSVPKRLINMYQTTQHSLTEDTNRHLFLISPFYTYLLTYLPTYLPTHPTIHLLTHPPTYSPTLPPTYLSTHPPTYLSTWHFFLFFSVSMSSFMVPFWSCFPHFLYIHWRPSDQYCSWSTVILFPLFSECFYLPFKLTILYNTFFSIKFSFYVRKIVACLTAHNMSFVEN